MIRGVNENSILRDLKLRCHQYLRETTVHGLRYLIEGRNLCEVAVWGIIITLGFTLSFAGVYTSINDAYHNPILTSVKTTQIQTVS